MAHGALDYTHITQAKMIAASVELDLPVVLLDRFDSANFLWNGTGTGAGWICARNAADAYEGDAGMELVTRAAGSLAGDIVTAQRYAFITPTTKLSFSSLFRLNQSTAFVESIQWLITGRYADQLWTTGIRYRAQDWDWDYWNAGGGWTEFLTGENQGLETWNRVYFEIDLANWQYITFETNENQVNLQSIPTQHALLAGLKQLSIEIALVAGINGTPADVSIDNTILKELGG
jgi:hypothetical protein